MNDTERELGRVLHDLPALQPDPGLYDRVQAGIRRRHRARRATLGGAGAVIVAIGAVAAVLTAGGSGRDRLTAPATQSPTQSPTESPTPATTAPAGVVPWVDRPAPAYTPEPTPTPSARYRSCTANQLTGRDGGGGAAATFLRTLLLTNDSGQPCTLAGRPRAVVGVRADGSNRTFPSTGGTAAFNLITPANLRPGQSARTVLSYSGTCHLAPGPVYTSALIELAGGGDVPVSFRAANQSYPGPLAPGCRVFASAFGVPAPPSPEATSPLDVLAATTHLPATFAAGTTEPYTVSLHNPTGRRVALRPCPSYQEFAYPLGGGGGGPAFTLARYYLDCRAAPDIPAHGTVTFAARLTVPKALGPAKFGWLLQGTTVVRRGLITITPGRAG